MAKGKEVEVAKAALDVATVKACIEAAKKAPAGNGWEEAGREKVVAALEALLEK